MPGGRMRGVVRELRQRALADSMLSDGELLGRYLAGREDAAFAALVRRHGPMVLGVCRRIVGDPHDADDAFQATFLVLVRRAASIKPRERVGAWLYGVAYRTALKARAMSQRRRSKQEPLTDVPAPGAPPDGEWLVLLDREIQRLPEKYRLPIVLCDLEGKTRKQAAAALGWPEGTVATRLRDGRALVQKRLARHGLAVTGAAASFAWGQALSAITVPAPLSSATIELASAFASGKAAGLIPLNILALAEGVLNAMMFTKLKSATAVVMLLAVLGAGLHGLAGQDVPTVGTPVERRPAAPDAPPPTVVAPRSGLEENNGRLPTTPPPVQALVSIDKDKVVVRTVEPVYRPRSVVDSNNHVRTMYEVTFMLAPDRYDRKEVEFYDTRGRKLDSATADEKPALVVFGKQRPDPLHLRLMKEDTLIVSLPARAAPPPTVLSPAEPLYVPPPPTPPLAVPPIAPAAPPNPPPALVPQPASPATVVPPPAPSDDAKRGSKSASAIFREAEQLLQRGDYREALRVLQTIQERHRKNVVSFLACHRIFQSLGLIAEPPEMARIARDAAQEAVRKALVDVTAMSAEDKMFRGAGVWSKQDWQDWLAWANNEIARLDSSPPMTARPPAIRRDATIREAERDMDIAAFYLREGKRESAAFYYELVRRRWPGTIYAERAAAVLGELRRSRPSAPATGQAPAAPATGLAPAAEARIGQIIITGNNRVPHDVIRRQLNLYPGQALNDAAIRGAEERLRAMKEFVNVGPLVNLRPTITVLETGQAPYKDILVNVREVTPAQPDSVPHTAGTTPPPAPARIAQIIIRGNNNVPDDVIWRELPLQPGQPFNYADLRKAEDTLRSMKDLKCESGTVTLRPTITVLETQGEDKDILVVVQETVTPYAVSDLNALQGAWSVAEAAVNGKPAPPIVGSTLTFTGDHVVIKTKSKTSKYRVVLQSGERPKRLRLLDDPLSRTYAAGTYQLYGDDLTLTIQAAMAPPEDMTTLTLKRHRVGAVPPVEPAAVAKTAGTKAPIRFEDRARGLSLTARDLKILPGNRVLLTDCDLWQNQDAATPQRIRGERVLLTLDGPLEGIEELGERQIIAIQVNGGSSGP